MKTKDVNQSLKQIAIFVCSYVLVAICVALKVRATPHKIVSDVTVNIMSLGADNTGIKDCSDLVRQAQAKGNVYFPAGTYLMSAVDVISNRKYYGDGEGKTIIKGNTNGVKTIFSISTKDYDKSNHPPRNIENVQISDLTLDFNFTDKWIDFFCPIQFKGLKGNYIKNILITNIEFIDNAKTLHPGLLGQPGKDAWCINFSSFADSTVDVTVKNCVSNAEGHQFVSGGGSVLKRFIISDNYIQKPKANGIAFTSVSPDSVDFEDFTVSGNTIVDPAGSAFLFGHDPGKNKIGMANQIFSGLKITNNTVILGNINIYGTNYRKKESFPVIVNLITGEPYLKDVLFENNTIKVSNDYAGGDIFLTKMQSYSFHRDDNQLATDFIQPAINLNVEISVPSNLHMGKSAFLPGGYVGIFNGGVYKVIGVNNTNITLQLTDYGNYANAGTHIPAGSKIKFIGGKLDNIQFINNHISGPQQLKILPAGIVTNFVAHGNNQVSFVMQYSASYVDKVDVSNNTDFDLQVTAGNIRGKMSENSYKSSRRALNTSLKPSTVTGLQEKVNLDVH